MSFISTGQCPGHQNPQGILVIGLNSEGLIVLKGLFNGRNNNDIKLAGIDIDRRPTVPGQLQCIIVVGIAGYFPLMDYLILDSQVSNARVFDIQANGT